MPNRPGGDLRVPPGPGLPHGLVVPAAELHERFSRASGPGGQGVNTTDSRVQLDFDPATCEALTSEQRDRLLVALGARLVDGRVLIAAAEFRSQRRNRVAARLRLVRMLANALAPPAPRRRPTRPTRGSQHRRLDAKKRRAQTKAARGRVTPD